MQLKKIGIILFVLCCSFLFFFSDQKEATAQKSNTNKPIVSAHTYGNISCNSSIRIRFAEDIVAKDRINKPLETSPIEFVPNIEGTALWVNSNTLEFRPDKKLTSGKSHKATITLSDSMVTGGDSWKFNFAFTAMKQAFEIAMEGLYATDENNISTQQFKGRIFTADIADNRDVEAMFVASQEGEGLKISWIHESDGKQHSFMIEDIKRKAYKTEAILKWDGKPIGVNKKGEEVLDIPSLLSFTVLQMRSVREDTKYVEIRFSDPIKKDQDLNGLIWENDHKDLRFNIDRNIIMVYSGKNWSGEVVVFVEPGIQNIKGRRLGNRFDQIISFKENEPQVRFAGKGNIIPTTQGLTIPIEAVNLRAVTVEAMNIYEKNIPQFLQVNDLEGEHEIKRVGRIVWKKTIPLEAFPNQKNQWVRYGLDISPFSRENPGGLYRIKLSFKKHHIIYDCPNLTDTTDEDEIIDEDDEEESSYWDSYEENYTYNDINYYERKNPCNPAYYKKYDDHDISVSRNILISDIGLIAKKGSDGKFFIAATDIKTARPLTGVDIAALDYQQQKIAEGKTGTDGTIMFSCDRIPFMVVATNGEQTGYLKCDDGSALSVSHFDVSGATLKKGLKGFIYGERGVWRPGDTLYLTFILMDSSNRLPEKHPVLFELLNPKGQVIHSKKEKLSDNGFYCFKPKTDPDALTGNWSARVKVGGATFEKVIKIETVMPNRLKIGLDFGDDIKGLMGGQFAGKLTSTWLHGAIAKGLKADVKLKLSTRRTHFTGYDEYSFDDPVREYKPESHDIFEGVLDDKGTASINAYIMARNVSPGMLTANFTTRVFEPGGAFSIDQFNIPYHPFDRYIGVRVPKGDKARGMLLTDTTHTVHIAALTPNGDPVEDGQVEIEIYKIRWRWWWEKGEESIASYIGTSSYTSIRKEIVDIKDGKAEWNFEIKYPSWGRYLIRVKDLYGKHITGKVVYVDWPGWAGRPMNDSAGGAAILSFSSDRESYKVGETVALTIPTGKKGRGLISFETGNRILKTEWFEAGEGPTRFEFTATSDMSPNVYAHVTFMQPHLQTENDLPIRMYGVIPVKVTDPDTKISPVISAPDVLVPEDTALIEVKEETGMAMTYTLAIVDEGLLDITRFRTPDPWGYFYRREALGVKTWDLFDFVAGAYGGTLERMLAVGGDDAADKMEDKKANRFPPMVRFLGPFDLEPGKTNTHEVDIPQYVGSVRIMAVAGKGRAFGFDYRTAFVRKPLMVLGTLPRVLGPEEEVELPVSVFALEENIKDVSVSVICSDLLSVEGASTKQISFSEPGDDMVSFRFKAGNKTGIATVKLTAEGNGEKAEQSIELDIRNPGAKVADIYGDAITPNESWQQDIVFPGTAGTNEVLLEVSRIPPLNLGKRLGFLISYPHGCVEQTTSSVFPQLYLNKLVELSPAKGDEIQHNIKAGIERLRMFQTFDGGFSYWPGSGQTDDWASNYAGHFLVEAERAGYYVPPNMLEQWKKYQRKRARVGTRETFTKSELNQAYRLYTLALANAPELGAMNRLRERNDIPVTARWRLAAAYQLAGQSEAARDLTKGAKIEVKPYRELSNTYGSDMRDKAMILESLSLMNWMREAAPLISEISDELSSNKWLSTQTTAYSLIAMARYAGVTGDKKEMMFDFSWNRSKTVSISSSSLITQMELPVEDMVSGKIVIENRSETIIHPRVIVHGTPPIGEEKSVSNGITMDVNYFDLKGYEIDPARLDQGTDFIAEVSLRNVGGSGVYEEVALTNIFPSGWEIHNERMNTEGPMSSQEFDYQDIRDDRVYTYFDIKPGYQKRFRVQLNASYLGRFYLPMIRVEAMYDETINARIKGRWITVERPGVE